MANREDITHQIEYMEPRNTVRNETVRANNKRIDRGEKLKRIPKGRAGTKTWQSSGRKSSGR